MGAVSGQNLCVAIGREPGAPRGFDDLHLEAVPLAHVNPAVAEHTVASREHLVTCRQGVGQRRFPSSGPGGRENEDVRAVRLQNLANVFEAGVQDSAKGRRPVIDCRHVAGLADFFRHVGRAGDEDRILEAHDALLCRVAYFLRHLAPV